MAESPEGGVGSQSGSGTGGHSGSGTGATDGGAPPGGTGSSTTGSGSSATGSGSSTSGSGSSTTGTGSSTSGCGTCCADNQSPSARGTSSTNGCGAPNQSPCLGPATPQHATFPSNRMLSWKETLFLNAVLAGTEMLPGGTVVSILAAAGTIASANGCTVALGYGGDAIGIGGGSAGIGIFYAPNGTIGLYGAVGLDAGFALGLSAEVVYTIIAGAPNVNFQGDCWAVTVSGGELATGGVTAFFAFDTGKFVGISVAVGAGLGCPISIYGQLSHTWITPPV